jgi:hypothetical protein
MENLIFTRGYKDVKNTQLANFMFQNVALQATLTQTLRSDEDIISDMSNDSLKDSSDESFDELHCKTCPSK